MKIIILGSNGQLGFSLSHEFKKNYEVYSFKKQDLDICDKVSIEKVLTKIKPKIVINAAAYTKVDLSEENKETAYNINFKAVEYLAKLSEKLGIYLIHYSTDYVFDGLKKTPYRETDIPNPINIYGDSKLKGEVSVSAIMHDYYIFRTSWNIGLYGNNFVTSILNLAKKNEKLNIVNDQTGVPTTIPFITMATLNLVKSIESGSPWKSGIYHLTPNGMTNWFEMAKIIINLAEDRINLKASTNNIVPIPSSKFKTIASRPKNSLLSNKKLSRVVSFKIPYWKDEFKNIVQSILKSYV